MSEVKPSSLHIDPVSLLVEVDAEISMATLTRDVQARGFVIHLPSLDESVGTWLSRGAPGAPSPWRDPVDHLLAGFEAEFRARGGVHRVLYRPVPRRSVGPDLTALVWGARGRFARLIRVWLRVHTASERRVARGEPGSTIESAPTADEQVVWDRIAEALGGVPFSGRLT